MSGRRFQTLGRALACGLLAISLVELAAAQPGERGDSARSRDRALEQAPPSFQEWVESLPEGQRAPVLRRLSNMPPHRRNRMFHRWEAMEEGERRKFQAFLEERAEARERGDSARPEAGGARLPRRRLEQLSPESREKLAPLVRRWRDMEPGERRRMRQRLERFRMLSPEDQEAMIEKKFEAKSPEKRARILESLREASKALPPRPLLDAPDEPPAPIATDPTP
jgi:hypothetical protein